MTRYLKHRKIKLCVNCTDNIEENELYVATHSLYIKVNHIQETFI